ncbi:MAG: TadE/TadG family type IV pilus assembly protein [Nitrospirota bacterium]
MMSAEVRRKRHRQTADTSSCRSSADRRLFNAVDGASAVEFALVLPLLLLLILGMVEFGTLFYRQAIISWSSREAARTGIVQAAPKPTAGQVQAVVSSVLSKASLGTSTVAVTVTGAGGAFGTDLTVLVESPYRFQFLPGLVPGMPASVTLRGRTVMKNE